MLKRVLPILCVIATAILVGCGGGADNTNGGNANTTTNANRATTTNTATTNTAATTNAANTSTTAAAGEKVGVAECDDYIAKYDACVNGKVPAAARAQYEASMKKMIDSWRTLAANAQTKASLAQACKTAVETSRASMKSFGCDF